MMRSVCANLLVLPPITIQSLAIEPKKLVDRNVIKIKCLSLFVCKLISLKFEFGLNHCKCTDHTSNKSEFSLSPDIVLIRIKYES